MAYLNKQIEELDKKIEETKRLLEDPDMVELAKDEIKELEEQKKILETDSPESVKENSSLDNHSVLMEIRAAAGGNEAGIFAADLYRMYTRFADEKKWKVEQVSINEGGVGNIKEVIFKVAGKNVYGSLKYESGVHRVQRVPITDSSGRIHTSTATVAVLPDLKDQEFHINPKDIKLETFRASSHGGQSVQKVESAVRLTHIPTGIAAICQSERSQFQNKERAMNILRARVFEAEQAKKKESIDSTRKVQVGSGDRSEKIRTYNFPQDRITDHRIGKSWYNIEDILDGKIDPIIKSLAKQ